MSRDSLNHKNTVSDGNFEGSALRQRSENFIFDKRNIKQNM